MGVKIGIGAMFEELADDGILWQLVPQLADLTEAGDAQTRADACHYLGLTGDPRATEAVKRLLEDENPEVREIAAETRDLLESRDS
jgi:HEAT repeat protein